MNNCFGVELNVSDDPKLTFVFIESSKKHILSLSGINLYYVCVCLKPSSGNAEGHNLYMQEIGKSSLLSQQ